jgi:tetratricopeptide (TPR) repeat protein
LGNSFSSSEGSALSNTIEAQGCFMHVGLPADIEAFLNKVERAGCAQRLLKRTRKVHNMPVHFAIGGLVKAGKSTLVRALLALMTDSEELRQQIRSLPVDVTPATACPVVFSYSEECWCNLRFTDSTSRPGGFELLRHIKMPSVGEAAGWLQPTWAEVFLPLPQLRNLHICDTAGIGNLQDEFPAAQWNQVTEWADVVCWLNENVLLETEFSFFETAVEGGCDLWLYRTQLDRQKWGSTEELATVETEGGWTSILPDFERGAAAFEERCLGMQITRPISGIGALFLENALFDRGRTLKEALEFLSDRKNEERVRKWRTDYSVPKEWLERGFNYSVWRFILARGLHNGRREHAAQAMITESGVLDVLDRIDRYIHPTAFAERVADVRDRAVLEIVNTLPKFDCASPQNEVRWQAWNALEVSHDVRTLMAASLVKRAYELFLNNETAQAAIVAMQGVTQDQGCARARAVLACALFELGRETEGEREALSALRLNNDLALAWAAVGTLHCRQKRYEEAEGECRRANALDPGEPIAHKLLGEVYARTQRPHEAEIELRCSAEFAPQWAGPRELMTDLQRHLEEARRRPTPLSREHLETARQLQAKNRLTEALRSAQAAAYSSHDWPEPYQLLAGLHRQGRDWQLAEAAASKCLALDSNRSVAYITRGICRLELGQIRQGKEDLDRAEELEQSGLIYAYRGIARFRLATTNPRAGELIERATVTPNDESYGAAVADLKRACDFPTACIKDGIPLAAIYTVIAHLMHNKLGNYEESISYAGLAIRNLPGELNGFNAYCNSFKLSLPDPIVTLQQWLWSACKRVYGGCTRNAMSAFEKQNSRSISRSVWWDDAKNAGDAMFALYQASINAGDRPDWTLEWLKELIAVAPDFDINIAKEDPAIAQCQHAALREFLTPKISWNFRPWWGTLWVKNESAFRITSCQFKFTIRSRNGKPDVEIEKRVAFLEAGKTREWSHSFESGTDKSSSVCEWHVAEEE